MPPKYFCFGPDLWHKLSRYTPISSTSPGAVIGVTNEGLEMWLKLRAIRWNHVQNNRVMHNNKIVVRLWTQNLEMGMPWDESWADSTGIYWAMRLYLLHYTSFYTSPKSDNLSRNISTWSHHHHHAFTCIHCSVASLSILVHHANFSHIQKSTGRFENSPLEPAIHIRKGCTNMVCFSYKMSNSAWDLFGFTYAKWMWSKKCGKSTRGETSPLAGMGYIGLPVLAIPWGMEQQCVKSISWWSMIKLTFLSSSISSAINSVPQLVWRLCCI